MFADRIVGREPRPDGDEVLELGWLNAVGASRVPPGRDMASIVPGVVETIWADARFH